MGSLLLRRDWLLASAGLLLGTAACASEPTWERVTADDASFSVLMPNRAHTSVQKADSTYGKIDTHFTTAVFRGTTYSLMWVDYPVDAVSSERRALDYAVSGALFNTGAKLLEQTEIQIDGFPGRELRASGATDLPMWVRIYLVGRRLFQLTVSGPNRPEIEANARKFLDSFHLRDELRLEKTPQ